MENNYPINRFTEIGWYCKFYFEDGKLIPYLSHGHRKTENDNWNPESIVKSYKKRISQLNKMKNDHK